MLENHGILPINMYKPSEIIDDVILDIYEAQVREDIDQHALQILMFGKSYHKIVDLAEREKWHKQNISTKLILEEEIELTKKEMEKNLSMGFPKLSKMDKIESFIKSTDDGIALLFLLNRILDFLSSTDFSKETIIEYREISTNLKTSINLSILRDISKGLLYKLFHEISSHKNKLSILINELMAI